jgi:hypothetical protein
MTTSVRRYRRLMAGLFIVFTLGAGSPPAAALPPVQVVAYGWLPELASLDWEAAQEAAEVDGPSSAPGVRLYRLLTLARSYAQQEDVPYVWGGGKVGDPESCRACRACLLKKKRRAKLETRHRSCAACQQCGVDCSHFVNKVFREAGLDYRYASTSEFMRRGRSEFVEVGRDAASARAGDLLFYSRHVVMLVAKREGQRGDFVHVSRSARNDRLGGIELVEDHDLSSFRGRLLKILRHEALLDAPPSDHFALSE